MNMLADQHVEIAAFPHPLRNSGARFQKVAQGPTVAEIVTGLDLSEFVLRTAQVVVSSTSGSTVIPLDMWGRVRPRAGSHVLVTPRVEGAAAAALLSAVIPTASSYVAGSLFGLTAGTFGYAAAYAAVTVVGSLLVNALIKPPAAPGSQQEDPNFTITGQGNAENRYGVYPTVLGRHLIYPPKTARGYTEGVGDDIYYRGRFSFGYGPVALETLRIGTTPIWEFSGVEIEFLNIDQSETLAAMPELAPLVVGWRTGAEAMTLYPSDIAEDAYSAALDRGVSVVRRTQARTISAEVDVAFGGGMIWIDKKGRRKAISSSFRVEYKAVGATEWTIANDAVFSGASRAYMRRTIHVALPAQDQYDLRVTRLTDNSGLASGNTVIEDATLSGIRSVQSGDLPSHENLAEVAVRIRASEQLNGQVGTLNAIAHQLAPIWDGSSWSALQKVRHPAWVYARALMGPSLQNPVADNRIVLDDLLEWAQQEPHWTCDTVIDQPTTLADVLDLICAAGRARRTLRDLKYSIIRDGGAGPVVQQFSPRNSWGFTGEINFPRILHGFRVRFTSEHLDWQQDELVAYADGFGPENATEFETLDLRGVVVTANEANGGNAWRLGRYHLAQATLRPETFTLQSDLDHLRVNMGDKIRLIHDVPLVGVGSGRVQSASFDGPHLREFVLDELMGLSGSRYRIRGAARGQMISFEAEPPSSQTGVWRVVGDVTALVAVGDLLMVEDIAVETMELLVTSIRHAGDLKATIKAVPAAPDVLLADKGRIPDYVPSITRVAPRELAPARPVLASVVPTVLFGPARVVARVAVAEQDRFDADRYHAALEDAAGNITRHGPFADSRFDLPLPEAGIYRLRVWRESALGRVSEPVKEIVEWMSSLTRPEDVTDFKADVAGHHAALTWATDDPLAKHFEIRFLAEGNLGGWSSAAVIESENRGGQTTVPAIDGTYLIKAVGHWGDTSVAASTVIITDSRSLGQNLVETIDEHAAFAGVKSQGLEAAGGTLYLRGNQATSGEYIFATDVDLGAVYTSRLSADFVAIGYLANDRMSSWPKLSDLGPLSGEVDNSLWAVRLMMRSTQDDPTLQNWSDWQDFRIGDHTARGYQFKLVANVTSVGVEIAISKLSVVIDMPDRVEGGEDVACPPGGVTITFDPPFRSRPAVAVTAQQLPSGAVVVRSGETQNGFHVKFTDATGADIGGSFDWVAKGHGRAR